MCYIVKSFVHYFILFDYSSLPKLCILVLVPLKLSVIIYTDDSKSFVFICPLNLFVTSVHSNKGKDLNVESYSLSRNFLINLMLTTFFKSWSNRTNFGGKSRIHFYSLFRSKSSLMLLSRPPIILRYKYTLPSSRLL